MQDARVESNKKGDIGITLADNVVFNYAEVRESSKTRGIIE